jgi:peptidoglycan/xylan/chitin deacetylase (PgdA/CDA1 family)
MKIVGPLPLTLVAFVFLAVSGARAQPAAPRTGGRMVAVTIDDLPINGVDAGLRALTALNDRLLAAVKRQGVPAIGFVNESKLYRPGEVDGRIALLRAWVEQGLELGNHTYSHLSLNKVGRATFEEEVVRGETVTRWLMKPRGLRWFRHPFLDAGANPEDKAGFERFVGARGYRIAPVTLDASDWYFTYRYAVAKRRGDAALMERIASAYLAQCDAELDYAEAFAQRLFGRDIPHVFLMHENELSADHFDRVAEKMKARGYRFVPLEEAMADRAYSHEDRFVGGGANWLVRWAATEGITDVPHEPARPAWLESLEADRSPYDLPE